MKAEQYFSSGLMEQNEDSVVGTPPITAPKDGVNVPTLIVTLKQEINARFIALGLDAPYPGD